MCGIALGARKTVNSAENTTRPRLRRDALLDPFVHRILTRDLAAAQALSRRTDIGGMMIAMAHYVVMGSDGKEMPARGDEVIAHMPPGEALDLLMEKMRGATSAVHRRRRTGPVMTLTRQQMPVSMLP